MTDTESVDAGTLQLREFIAQLPFIPPKSGIDTSSLVAKFPYLADVEIDELEIDGPAVPVPARRYRVQGHAPIGLVWVHGGAFIAGDLDMPESHWIALELASRGISVLAIDYRKALDGVRFPAASDDVLAGWAAAAELLGVTADQLHLGGASAGGNLSAGISARLKRGSSALPASLILSYPVLHSELPPAAPDAAAAVETIPPEARFTPEFTRAINVNFVGGAENLEDPIAFPANGDLRGFPRTLIINAEADDLRASGEAFGHQLADAAVAVAVEFEPGTMHGYLNEPGSAAAIKTVDRIAAWLKGEGQ